MSKFDNVSGDFHLSALEEAMLYNSDLPQNPSDLEAMLIEDGYDVTQPKMQDELSQRLQPVHERIQKQQEEMRERPQAFTRMRKAALTVRDSIGISMGLFLLSIAPFAMIFFLFLSETFSVYLGIGTFLNQSETERIIAVLLSITTVGTYFVLEWRHASLLHEHGKPKSYRFTIANLWRRIKYTLSLTSEPEEKSYSYDLRETNSTVWWLRVLIVMMGVLGRMGDELLVYADLPWAEAIGNILLESSVVEFLEYAGGAFLAIALLIGTRYTVRMMYEVFDAASGGGESLAGFFDASLAQEELEKTKVQFYQMLIRRRWNRKKSSVYQKVSKDESSNSLNQEGEEASGENIEVSTEDMVARKRNHPLNTPPSPTVQT